jgi:pimeloyl-ACP methyl ester carboxylesterase
MRRHRLLDSRLGVLLGLSLLASSGGLAAPDRQQPPGDGGSAATTPAPPPAGFRSESAEVNGIRLHYVIGGQGDAVVLVHGWPQTWYEWHRLMPQLADRYTVIAPDLRGAGESDKPFTSTGYPKVLLAEDLHQLVRTLGFERVFLVGHDIGVMVAFAYAMQYPEEVRRLVLLDVPVPGAEPYWTQAEQDPRLWHVGFHNERGFAERMVQGREREYLTHFYEKYSFGGRNPMTAEEVDEFVRAYSQPGALTGGFEWYRAFSQDEQDNAALLRQRGKLRMPVLALGGESSGGPTMVPMARTIAEDVRGGSIPGAGHWMVEEQPELLLQELLAFFGEESPVAAGGAVLTR